MLDNPLVHWKLLIYRKRKQQPYIQLALFAAHIFQLQVTQPPSFWQRGLKLWLTQNEISQNEKKKKQQTHTEGMKSIVKYDGGDFRSLLGAASLVFPFRLRVSKARLPGIAVGFPSPH